MSDDFDWQKWSQKDWEALARAQLWLELNKFNALAPPLFGGIGGGPIGTAPVAGGGLLGLGPPTVVDCSMRGGGVSWGMATPTVIRGDEGSTGWDGDVVFADGTTIGFDARQGPVWTEEDYAAAFRLLRDQAYSSEAWSVIEGEVIERAKFECAGCMIEDAEAAPRLAVAARPYWYSMNDDGTYDFMCKHLRYMLVPLCSECCEAHDKRFDGMGMSEKGPYIR